MSKRNPATSQSSGSFKQPTKKLKVPTAAKTSKKTKNTKGKTFKKFKKLDKNMPVETFDDIF